MAILRNLRSLPETLPQSGMRFAREGALEVQPGVAALELNVYDEDKIGQDSFLGSVCVRLDDLDEDVADTDSRIAFVTNQTKELIAQSGGTKWFCLILALAVLALFLFFLIIS